MLAKGQTRYDVNCIQRVNVHLLNNLNSCHVLDGWVIELGQNQDAKGGVFQFHPRPTTVLTKIFKWKLPSQGSTGGNFFQACGVGES